jgi:cell division protein FtsL
MKRHNATEQKERVRFGSAAPVAAPVLKLRQLVAAILFVIILIIWPMFMVWKQIYITNVSIKESALSDTIMTLSKQSATLRICNEKLASTQRIESIARSSVGLEYPTSAQIVVITETRKDLRRRQAAGNGFLAILRRTFSRERG